MRRSRGSGSMRPLRPGVWEVRVALGVHPVSGRSTYRSITVHGDRVAAEHARARWAAKAELVRSVGRPRPAVTVGQVLVEWSAADQGWRPSTIAGNRSVVAYLIRDAL